jgi:hypothetical protein
MYPLQTSKINIVVSVLQRSLISRHSGQQRRAIAFVCHIRHALTDQPGSNSRAPHRRIRPTREGCAACRPTVISSFVSLPLSVLCSTRTSDVTAIRPCSITSKLRGCPPLPPDPRQLLRIKQTVLSFNFNSLAYTRILRRLQITASPRQCPTRKPQTAPPASKS